MTATTPERSAPDGCPHDGAAAPLGPRLARCGLCGVIIAQTTINKEITDPWLASKLTAAPDGVLRGKYRLLRKLGDGAHASTYLAQHEFLSHHCVVKILPQRVGETSDSAIRRLRNEARAGFRVSDPNVVRVLDCDVIRGTWYFVMEYVDGADLGEITRQQVRMPWQQAVDIAIDAARGLAAIHRLDLAHRDIKPANLLLGTDGRVRVADLGVAGLSREQAEIADPTPRERVGTLAYTAPETFQAATNVGPLADLYALGATLYHLVTGQLPHAGTGVFQRLIDLECRPVTWPTRAAPDTPAWLVDAILQLLAIEPADRFPSADRLLEALGATPFSASRTSTAVLPESLEPRGLGVLPFENERPGDDDWLGYALASHVSRGLSQVPGTYVADQDALSQMITRMEQDEARVEPVDLLAAGRMVGAGKILSGRYIRDGNELRISGTLRDVGAPDGRSLGTVAGDLDDLGHVERQLLERFVVALGLDATAATRTAATTRSPALAARERLVLGRQAFLRGEYEEATRLGRAAVELDPQFAEAIGFIGVCLARVGNYDEAAERHQQQEMLALEWGDGRLEVEALANLGVMNYFRGHYDEAKQYYERAAQRATAHGLEVEAAQVNNNLGFVLFRLTQPAEAEHAFLRAIETHRAYGGLASLVGPYNGMGNVLLEQERCAEARSYYRRALALAEEIGDRTSVGTTYMHLGRAAALEERFAEAKHAFTMALNTLEETRFWNGLARAYEYIAEMNLKLGDFEDAARCADRRIELARQHANKRLEVAAWQQKAEALRRAGRVADAEACLATGRGVETG